MDKYYSKCQIWYETNKDIEVKKNKEYYENNKVEYKKQIIECDCGGFRRRDNTNHKKTKMHQELMNMQTSAILSFLECF